MAGNSIQNNYQHFRSLRKDYSELKDIKPKLGDSWSSKNSAGLYLFENPIFENYITEYIEETQNDLTGSIDFEKFKQISWKQMVPNFILDFLGYITGLPAEIRSIMNEARRRIPREAARVSFKDCESELGIKERVDEDSGRSSRTNSEDGRSPQKGQKLSSSAAK